MASDDPNRPQKIGDEEFLTDGSELFDEPQNRICVTIGALTVEVEGDDPEWVAEQFEARFEQALAETGEMSAALREARGYW